jgi:hypothetical protein
LAHTGTRLGREHVQRGQGQRVFLSDVPPLLVHDREAIRVRILGKTHIGARGCGLRAELAQVFAGRFRGVCEVPAGFGVKMHQVAAQPGQQGPTRRSAGAIHAVQHHAKTAFANAGDVHDTQDPFDVVVGRGLVTAQPANLLDRHQTRLAGADQREQFLRLG